MRRLLALLLAPFALLPLTGLVDAVLPVHPGPGRRLAAQLADMEARYAEGCPPALGVAGGPDTGPGDVLAHSHVATGLMSAVVRDAALAPRAEALIGAVVACMRASPPAGVRLADPGTWGDDNLYLSHLALALGIQASLGSTDDREHAAVVRHLRARSLADGDYHARSYPRCCKWPADQAVTLDALALYDRLHHTTLSARPIQGWLRLVGEDLHPSAITTSLWYHDLPRGCALSWTAFHMAQFAPEQGRALYARTRAELWVDVAGLGGFREWPVGTSGAWDVDSGPVIAGIGMGATGLGLAPARLYGDTATAAAIERTSLLFGLPWGWRSREMLAVPFLADAILFHDAAAVPWFDPIPAIGSTPTLPWVPAALLLLDLAILAGIGRALLRAAPLRAGLPRAPEEPR